MDLNQFFSILGNNGLAIFLVIWYVFKQSKIDSEMTKAFQELSAAIRAWEKHSK
jgi:hypothetical protein